MGDYVDSNGVGRNFTPSQLGRIAEKERRVYMEMRGQLKTIEDVKRYMLAGKSTITIRSAKTQTRFTFKVTQKKDQSTELPIANTYYVKLLNGSDNETSYTYMGMIRPNFHNPKVVEFALTRGSKVTTKAESFVAFSWLFDQLSKSVLPSTVEIWHEGVCGRCGRKLTVPESIAYGIGPVCDEKMGLPSAQSALFA